MKVENVVTYSDLTDKEGKLLNGEGAVFSHDAISVGHNEKGYFIYINKFEEIKGTGIYNHSGMTAFFDKNTLKEFIKLAKDIMTDK